MIRELRASRREAERAQGRIEQARERRTRAILAARAAGMSYRAIATEAGISFPAVQQVIQRSKKGG